MNLNGRGWRVESEISDLRFQKGTVAGGADSCFIESAIPRSGTFRVSIMAADPSLVGMMIVLAVVPRRL